jgi:excisionase family DNA binding protein
VTAQAEAGTPWMTTRQAAAYARRHRETVLLALRRGELQGTQRNGRANCTWRVHRDDVDRWMRGEPPARRKLRSA